MDAFCIYLGQTPIAAQPNSWNLMREESIYLRKRENTLRVKRNVLWAVTVNENLLMKTVFKKKRLNTDWWIILLFFLLSPLKTI